MTPFRKPNLTKADAIAIRAAPVPGPQPALGFRIALLPHGLPPPADGIDRKGRRIGICSDADPAGVVVDIVYAVRHGSFQPGINEVVHIEFFVATFVSPYTAPIRESDIYLLLCTIY